MLFGLSTDHRTFIPSRIRERRAAGADARASVGGGVVPGAGHGERIADPSPLPEYGRTH